MLNSLRRCRVANDVHDSQGFDELIQEALTQPDIDVTRGRGAGGRVWVVFSVASALVGIGVLVGALAINGVGPTRQVDIAAAPQPDQLAALPHEAEDARVTEQDIGEKQLSGFEANVDREWVAQLAQKTGIPARALTAYVGASLQVAQERPGCGLGWNTLAGIGQVESEHGRINGSRLTVKGDAAPHIIGIALTGETTDRIPDTDDGVLDRDTVWDRAVGPMQFIPSTWAEWGADANGDGVKNPQNIDDSSLAAARYLCDVGGDLNDPARWIAAVGAYNSSIEYNNRVASVAEHYAQAAE